MGLKRSLGALDGTALIFSNVLGVGIFTTPGLVFQSVESPAVFLTLWAVGGVVAFIGANAYSQLAVLFPKSGGEYLYLYKIFGPVPAFLAGWTSFIAGFSGAIAASAVGFAIYLNRITFLDPLHQKLIAVGVIVVICSLHLVSVRNSSKIHIGLTGFALIAILLLVIGGLRTKSPEMTISTFEISGSGLLLAFIPILFTYSGWNAAVYVAEEIKHPSKNMIRSLAGGTLLVVLIYMFLNIMYVTLIDSDQLAGSIEVGALLASKIFGKTGTNLVSLLILISLFSSVSAMTMAGPRIYFKMAEDGVIPARIARIHKKYQTPYYAILIQSFWSILLVISGTFEQILIYTGFSVILFSGMAVTALLWLRYKNNQLLNFRSLSYAGFVLLSLIIILNGLFTRPLPTLAGSIIILSGAPVFYWLKTKEFS